MKVLVQIFLLIYCVEITGQSHEKAIVELIGQQEYERLMQLDLDGFDQSPVGFRQYGSNYQLLELLIPEYINVNQLNEYEASPSRWHLGQIFAFNNKYQEAIREMRLSSPEKMPVYWKCYVDGTIAFLKKDMPALNASYELLKMQEIQMNVEFLEKFIKNFDKSYAEAYNAPY